MRASLVLGILAAAALPAFTACNSDSGLRPTPEQTFSAQMGGEGILVVDDGGDCPQAPYTSIQAAVLAAEPGDKVLVCPGTYLETVLVEEDDLRIEAQGAPGDVVVDAAGRPYGFHLLQTSGVLLQGFTVKRSTDANIIINGGSGNTLRKNVVTAGAVDGIELLNGDGNIIEQNVSSLNIGPRSDGMFVHTGSSDNIIRHNEVSENGLNGINLNGVGTDNNLVYGNRSYLNGQRGMQSLSGNRNVFENNHVFENSNIGILIATTRDVTVRNNRLENNHSDGIRVALNAADNLIEKNELIGNGNVRTDLRGHGIQLNNNADANLVRLNRIRLSGVDGIRVNDALSAGNAIERNIMHENVEHDAHDNSGGPGTGGTANFWINNHCQTDNRLGLLCEHTSGAASMIR